MSTPTTPSTASSTDSTTCSTLYKILTPSERSELPSSAPWIGTWLDKKDGFIHLSTSAQLPLTLSRFFNKTFYSGHEVVLMVLPRSNIDPECLKFDESEHGGVFGHIYGSIDPSQAFVKEIKVSRGKDDTFTLPDLEF